MFDDEEDSERERLTGGRTVPADLQAALAARRDGGGGGVGGGLPAGAIHHTLGAPGSSTALGHDDDDEKKAAKLEKIAVDTISVPGGGAALQRPPLLRHGILCRRRVLQGATTPT